MLRYKRKKLITSSIQIPENKGRSSLNMEKDKYFTSTFQVTAN